MRYAVKQREMQTVRAMCSIEPLCAGFSVDVVVAIPLQYYSTMAGKGNRDCDQKSCPTLNSISPFARLLPNCRTRRCQIGMDIEHIVPVGNLTELVRKIAHPDEQRAFQLLEERHKLNAFFRLWPARNPS
jgi:phosphopantetheinyl transferase